MKNPYKQDEFPRWGIVVLALAGVGVDLATLSWLWGAYDSSTGLTGGQVLLGTLAAAAAASLITLAVFLGVRRVRG